MLVHPPWPKASSQVVCALDARRPWTQTDHWCLRTADRLAPTKQPEQRTRGCGGTHKGWEQREGGRRRHLPRGPPCPRLSEWAELEPAASIAELVSAVRLLACSDAGTGPASRLPRSRCASPTCSANRDCSGTREVAG